MPSLPSHGIGPALGAPAAGGRSFSGSAALRRCRRSHDILPGLLALWTLGACALDREPPHETIEPGADYAEVAVALSEAIERERSAKSLGAVSVALVEGDSVVWAAGFGEEKAGRAAGPGTVYRVGSVSKLFTDIAVMRLAERGELDIDAPVTEYLLDFRPGGLQPGAPTRRAGSRAGGADADLSAAAASITLRQLMSHRAGLVREPPVGNYFDDSGPDLAASVASLNGTGLVYLPGTRTKYSNAGIAVVGRALEVTRETPFADHMRASVLDPLGMGSSAFLPEPELMGRLAEATMWGMDRAYYAAPSFELGMAPAGSMYSTVLDLARFMSAVFRIARGADLDEGVHLLDSATLELMWEPQFVPEGTATGFGLGFNVGELDGERAIGHGGAIYGFSTQLSFLPGQGLGVVVTSAVDLTNSFTSRVANAALEMMIAVRAGEALPPAGFPETAPVDPALARRLAGVYSDENGGLELDERGGRLFATGLEGGFTTELRTLGDTLIVDDRLSFGSRFLPEGDELVVLGAGGEAAARLAREPSVGAPPPPPAEWTGLIGEYGWDHNVLHILERRGELHALIEWFFLYPVSELPSESCGGGEGSACFAFPERGLYAGESLVFDRDPDGRASSVNVGSVIFTRRELGTESGETFRIDPVRPVSELLPEALAASPPTEAGPFRSPELVEPATLDSTLRLDVRYASTDNFMSSVFYDEARVFLQRPAAEALVRASAALRADGYGLVLFDGYRPWYVTRTFWDATPETQKIFVANPSNGSRHNRGSAIDLSLYDLASGEVVEMTGGYDEFSPRSFPDYPGGSSRQRWRRALLRRAMEDAGFAVYEAEWWHFDHEDWREYPILNLTFAELAAAN